jgi:hypothetical protein
MQHLRLTPTRLLGFSLLIFCLSAPAALRGQGMGQLIQNTDRDAFFKGSGQLTKLIAGSVLPTAADQELLDLTARWYIGRLTDTTLRGDVPNYGKKASDLIQVEFERQFIDRILGPNVEKKGNKAFVDKLAPSLVKTLQEVFKEDILEGDNRMVQVAVATMLPRIARLKQDDFGLYLAELVKDKSKHHAVRLYALKGLKEFLPAHYFDEEKDVGSASQEKLRDREANYVDALVGYIEGTYGPKAGEDDPEVISYLRREALETLGQVQLPVIGTNKRQGQAVGAVAPTLLKVLAKKGMTPKSSIHEKIEAAIGLSQMKYATVGYGKAASINEYRTDLAVYLVGTFIEEFAKKYNEEWANLKGNNAKVPSVAWKIQAKRLEEAVKLMRDNAKPDPLQIYKAEQDQAWRNAQKVMDTATPILRNIYDGAQVQPQGLVNYLKELQPLRPKDKTPFRSLKTPEIDSN